MLPKIQYPLFPLNIPSIGKQYLFRPFLVREEKILLMAQQSADNKQIILAIKQIIQNCLQDDQVDVDTLTMFDLEYLFIQLRASSIDNNVTVAYLDAEDDKEYKFDIDMADLKMTEIPTDRTRIIDLGDGNKVKMKYITASSLDDIPADLEEENLNDFLIASSIDCIYDADTVLDIKDLSYTEIVNWIDMLSIEKRNEMLQFVNDTPSILYEIKYTNSLGTERVIRLTSLRDFFTWG